MEIDWNLLYKKCFQAVTEMDIQALVQTGHDITGLPINIQNTNLMVLAMVPNTPQDDELWEVARLNRHSPASSIMMLEKEKVLQNIIKSDVPLYFNYHVFENHPRIACAIKTEKGELLGTMVALCSKQQFTSEYINVFNEIKKAAAIILEKTQVDYLGRTRLASAFIYELLAGKIQTLGQFKNWEKSLRITLKAPYRVLVFYADTMFTLKKLKEKLQTQFPEQLMWIQDDHLLMLQYNVKTEISNDLMEKIIRNTETSNIFCGASIRYSDILKTKIYIKQAIMSLKVGNLLNENKIFFSFEDYVFAVILSNAMQPDEREAYIHPAIPLLKQYDSENNTDYLYTLKSYVLNLGKHNAVTNALLIHRNTLLYRINKIEEIAHIDLSNPNEVFWLLCSFGMQRLQESEIQDN